MAEGIVFDLGYKPHEGIRLGRSGLVEHWYAMDCVGSWGCDVAPEERSFPKGSWRSRSSRTSSSPRSE